jgi:hypothetical protein
MSHSEYDWVCEGGDAVRARAFRGSYLLATHAQSARKRWRQRDRV